MTDKANDVYRGMGGPDERLTSGTLTPAFGRDYKNGREAEAAFRAGKDFILNAYGLPEKPVNKDAFRPGARIMLRFNRLTKTKMVQV